MATSNPLVDIIGKLAPALATGLTGGLAPAVVSILAQVFGVNPSLDEVTAAAASSDPEVLKANLARAEAAFKADAEQSISVQHQIDANVEMMKMDLTRGAYYSGWRPMAGWAAVLFYVSYACLILYQGFNGQYDALAHVGELSVIGVPIMALAGVVAWQRSEERKAIANGSSTLGELAKVLLNKV